MRRIYHADLKAERPTGIIRTLPSLYASRSVGARNYAESMRKMRLDEDQVIYIALSQMPKREVIHLYIVINGRIRVRLNIVEYREGTTAECWDGEYRTPKYWAVCAGPPVKPPERLLLKGFQGIRYTGDLW